MNGQVQNADFSVNENALSNAALMFECQSNNRAKVDNRYDDLVLRRNFGAMATLKERGCIPDAVIEVLDEGIGKCKKIDKGLPLIDKARKYLECIRETEKAYNDVATSSCLIWQPIAPCQDVVNKIGEWRKQPSKIRLLGWKSLNPESVGKHGKLTFDEFRELRKRLYEEDDWLKREEIWKAQVRDWNFFGNPSNHPATVVAFSMGVSQSGGRLWRWWNWLYVAYI